MALQEVKLKNGAIVPEPAVVTIMLVLTRLLVERPIDFYELVMKCRDENHQLSGNSVVMLTGLALLEPNGQPHDVTRDIILSAAVGAGPDMRLEMPLE